MTLANSHQSRLHRTTGTKPLTFRRLLKRAGAVLKRIHRAIAAARIRRLRNELMLHSRASGDWARQHGYEGIAERNGAKFPQHPVILDEKWDY